MNKFIPISLINLILIKLCVTEPDPSRYGETQGTNDANLLKENVGDESYNLASGGNDGLTEMDDDSLIQKSFKPMNKRERKPNMKLIKRKIKENEQSEKDTKVVKPTKTKNIKRKNKRMIKNRLNLKRKHKKCGRGKKCRKHCKGCKGRNSRKVPIRHHKSVNEESENVQERTSEVTNKLKVDPEIRKFGMKASKKIGDHALDLASNLTRDYVNKKIFNSTGYQTYPQNYYETNSTAHKTNEEPDDEDDSTDDTSEDSDNEEDVKKENKKDKKPKEEEYDDGKSDEGDDTYKDDETNEFESYKNEVGDQYSDEKKPDDDKNYEDDDEDDDDQEEEYTKKYKTPSGLEYLGAGYDLIKGNPFGDNVTLLDPGYRSSVIQMHWNKKLENISNSLQFLQPVGGWIRPYSSCHKVESVTEIKSSELLLKSLSADASVSFSLSGDALKFAASAKFKKLDDASKVGNTKTYMNKSYCFKYVAGISTSLKWDLTLGFQSSLERLTEFRGLDKDSGCQPSVYREDPNNENCQESGVSDWMQMFNSFGTHVSNKIYLGGKIFTTLEIEKNEEKKLSDQGLDVKAALSAQIKDSTVDSNVKISSIKSEKLGGNLLSTKKTTFVLGGDIYGDGKEIDFGDWSKTVSDHAMPIKAEFTPISHFIDKSLNESYNKAYLYYGKVVMESDYWRYQSQIELTPEDLIDEMDIKHIEGNSSVKLTCNDGMTVQFGFMIITLKDNSHQVIECPVQKKECSSPQRDDLIYSSLWISCRTKNIINLKQIVTKEKNPSCDSGWTIFLGSNFFETNSRYLLMKPCKLGHNKCETYQDTIYTWLVCFKKFWDLSSKTKVVKKDSSSLISCKTGESIVFGIGFEWIKNKDKTTYARFISAEKVKPTWLHICKTKCNRIIQYIICK